MTKQNISISRYSDDPAFAWEASVSPEDGSWVLFVPRPTHPDVKPQLWLAQGTTTVDGAEETFYLPAPGTAAGPCVVPTCEAGEPEDLPEQVDDADVPAGETIHAEAIVG